MKFNQKFYLEDEFVNKYAVDENLSNIEVKCISIVNKQDKLKYIIFVKDLNKKFNAYLTRDDHDDEPYFIIHRNFSPIKTMKIKKKLIDLVDLSAGY